MKIELKAEKIGPNEYRLSLFADSGLILEEEGNTFPKMECIFNQHYIDKVINNARI
jgi:hypothetical protein